MIHDKYKESASSHSFVAQSNSHWTRTFDSVDRTLVHDWTHMLGVFFVRLGSVFLVNQSELKKVCLG